MWYEEIKNCKSLPGCTEASQGEIDHFTALIWKGSEVMACTISQSGTIYACRYGSGPESSLSCDTPNMQGCYKENVVA